MIKPCFSLAVALAALFLTILLDASYGFFTVCGPPIWFRQRTRTRRLAVVASTSYRWTLPQLQLCAKARQDGALSEDDNNSGVHKNDEDEDDDCENGDIPALVDRIQQQQQQQQEKLPETISTIKIDDGGSDLTDRFKYKVQALMGNFDPVDATHDTEDNAGNILNAMMQFPAVYTFHVVGRKTTTTNDNDDDDAFVKSVVATIRQGAGLRDNAELDTTVAPRGSKFVKVSTKATVESAVMVTDIYNALRDLPNSVMQF